MASAIDAQRLLGALMVQGWGRSDQQGMKSMR
jgi:hypothetical protein